MNSSEQKQLSLKVHSAIEVFYTPFGFKLNPVNGVFYKSNFEVFWGIDRKTTEEIYFSPKLSVTNDKISELYKVIFSKACLITSKLAGFRLANEFGNHDYDYLNEQGIDKGTGYKVEPNTDIGLIVEHHAAYMKKVGFAFFEKMSTLEGIHDYINGRVLKGGEPEFTENMKQPQIARFFSKREVLSGTIAAYLISEPEIEKLLNRYRKMFEGNEYVLNDLEKVVDYFNNALSAKQ